MPILNGVKVACEPCIRGHRSTKCTHASERLMVPVRKPGRPLSACPHPPQQPCNCGHITAAIPRKQTCRCPDDLPTHVGQVAEDAFIGEPPTSPTRTSYRVQKASSRPQSSRKISVDSSALERMTMNGNVHFDIKDSGRKPVIVGNDNKPPWPGIEATGWQQDHPSLRMYQANLPNQHIMTNGTPVPSIRPQGIPEAATIVNQRTYPDGSVVYLGNGGKPLTLSEKIVGWTTEGKPVPPPHELGDIWPRSDIPLELANDASYSLYLAQRQQQGFSMQAYPTPHPAVSVPVRPTAKAIKREDQYSSPTPQPAKKSCCAPKNESHSHSSSSASSVSEPQEMQLNGASEPVIVGNNFHAVPDMFTEAPKQPMQPQTTSPEMIHGTMSISNGQGQFYDNPGAFESINAMTSPPVSYPQYMASNIVFTYRYPPTYGSFQNPFKPETWRQNLQETGYQPPQQNAHTSSSTFNPPLTQERPATIHECCCGDGCECLGCAAHPYNNTTQEYVRSAWAYEQPASTSEFTASPATPGQPLYGQQNTAPMAVDEVGGPQMIRSPTNSANGDDQNLSSSDFFFVDYPIGDGCGGETVTCPCGDDCACFGCTIHKPNTPQRPPTPTTGTTTGKSSCCS